MAGKINSNNLLIFQKWPFICKGNIYVLLFIHLFSNLKWRAQVGSVNVMGS